MHEAYTLFFEDIDRSINGKFKTGRLQLQLIGYSALALAGLPERGTKDLDVLETEALTDAINAKTVKFLITEFGQGSPGAIRHGIYLDIVAKSIPWIPPRPRFIQLMRLKSLDIDRLDPLDVCVSKIFAYFKSKSGRANDRKDIFDALDNKIISAGDYIRRVDETFSKYELHAEAAEIFPRVIDFINNEVKLKYASDGTQLTYKIPNWMENM